MKVIRDTFRGEHGDEPVVMAWLKDKHRNIEMVALVIGPSMSVIRSSTEADRALAAQDMARLLNTRQGRWKRRDGRS